MGPVTAETAWTAIEVLVKLVLTLWMIRISMLDHRSGRIPNALTAPVFLGVGFYRIVVQGLMMGQFGKLWLILAWIVLFGLWMLNFIGGGDAKFLMALFALFPSLEFLAALAFILLIIMVPLLILEFRMRDQSIGGAWRSLRARLMTGQILPTNEELQTQGRRYAWTFAVPAIVYMWIYWSWPVAPGWIPL